MSVTKCLLILLLFCFTLKSQTDSLLIKESAGGTLKKLSKNALLQNDPNSAIQFLNAYLKNSPADVIAIEMLGKAHMQVRDYKMAQVSFMRAYKLNKNKVPEALYYHAVMQKSNEQYDSAKVNFERFKKEYKGSNRQLKKMATKEISFCDSIKSLLKPASKTIINRLDTFINKVNTEASPMALDDNTIIFSSLRTDKIEYTFEEDTVQTPKKKLYIAKRKNGQWNFEGEYLKNINGEEYNVSNACFSLDRKRLYFTKCKLNYREEMICAIYMIEKKGDSWTEPIKLDKNINSFKYTSTMPALGADPVKGNDVLYFVSNRKRGKGGLDIWYSVYDKKNKVFKPAKNAGNKINSTQNEITPYFDNETKSLYYSSDGLGGLGGYDIFKASGDGKRWSGVNNIGVPVNTGADDIYYSISTNRQEGFFVSNRKGSAALKNKTCCDDIYTFKNSDYIQLKLKGKVTEALDDASGIAGASIEIYVKGKPGGEKFLLKTISSDSLGNYETNLEAGNDYYFVVKKPDYLGSSGEVNIGNITSSQVVFQDMHLVKRPKDPIHIPNISYEFDRANMTSDSKITLDTTVLVLMQLNPELVIEIQAHTDSKGSDAYNLKLSQKRAESVVSYLISKGITPKRLIAKGYGETKPIAPNTNKDGTDNPEGRAQNRRTDFKIIGVIDAEIIYDSVIE